MKVVKITVEEFDALSGLDKQKVLAALPGDDQKRLHAEMRVMQIVRSAARIQQRLKDNPDHPKREGWAHRLAEYAESIKNLGEFGQETKPTGNPVGAAVNVPAKLFAIEGNA